MNTLNIFCIYFCFSLTTNITSGMWTSHSCLHFELLLYSLLFLPAVFFSCVLPTWCLFSYNLSSHHCVKCSFLVLFSEMYFGDKIPSNFWRSLLASSWLLFCLLYLTSPVSQQVCLRSSCLFDITKVFLLSLRQPLRTTRVTAILQCVQRLMVVALENSHLLCREPRGIISQNVHLLQKCQGTG